MFSYCGLAITELNGVTYFEVIPLAFIKTKVGDDLTVFSVAATRKLF